MYHLWNLIIKENDELFIHFYIVAYLQYRKDDIISTDYSQIPSILSQLYIRSINEADEIIKIAFNIKNTTPFSFRLMARKLEIFKPKSNRLKDLFDLYEPESMLAMPILPSEIFQIAYNNIVSCPDNICKNFKNLYEITEKSPYNKNQENDYFRDKLCFYCDKKKRGGDNNTITQNISYILLDLRISKEKSNDKHYDVKPGFLPMTVILDQEELSNENFAENLSDRFINEKEKYHFILITTETDYFSEYEHKFYREKLNEKEKKKMIYGLQTRVSKEINIKILKSHVKKDKSKKVAIRIKELDNLKKLIRSLMKKNYKYISYVHGGFKEIHDQSIKYNIPLLNHDESCHMCKKNQKKNHKVGFFSKLFKNDKKLNKKIESGELQVALKKENSRSMEQKELNIFSKLFI